MILSEQTFIELAGKQEVLDAKIKQKNRVTDLPLRRIGLYYRIELAECLNELKGDFKHWSNKPMNREAFIEELVDALHFFLSCINHMVEKEKTMFPHISHIGQYQELLGEYHKYKEYVFGSDAFPSWEAAIDVTLADSIHESFAILLCLAERYDFTEQDIIDTYNRKNAVNHDRSDSGVY